MNVKWTLVGLAREALQSSCIILKCLLTYYSTGYAGAGWKTLLWSAITYNGGPTRSKRQHLKRWSYSKLRFIEANKVKSSPSEPYPELRLVLESFIVVRIVKYAPL